MWTLNEIRDYVGDRVAEESTVFWSTAERERAINDAQRFIAAATRGVPALVTGTVSTATPYLSLPDKALTEYEVSGWVVGNTLDPLNAVPARAANVVFPGWANFTGRPRWILIVRDEDRVYVCPAPSVNTTVTIKVSVLPDDLVSDSDELFNGEDVMEKYQSAVLNLSVAFLLLKERYDGDAERFYQFAIQELQQLGASEIPSFDQVRQQRGNSDGE